MLSLDCSCIMFMFMYYVLWALRFPWTAPVLILAPFLTDCCLLAVPLRHSVIFIGNEHLLQRSL